MVSTIHNCITYLERCTYTSFYVSFQWLITLYTEQGKLRNGTLAAIKVLSAESRQGVHEFLTEIKVITSVEHENLVKLYGCCVQGNHRILVYGYLENNSLAQALVGK